MSIQTDIAKLQDVLNEALMNEFEAQGHSMTGKLVKDIEYVVKTEVDKLTISGMMYPYANYLAHGAKWPNKRPPIGPIQEYVKLRMRIIDEKESKSIAFAIAANLKKEGMPTKGGMPYSSTGKRDNWITEAFKRDEDKITEVIEEMAFNMLTVKLDTLIDRWQVELNR